MKQVRLNILLADDTTGFRQGFADWLREDLGHAVIEAENADEALDQFLASQGNIHLAILDYYLPGYDIQNGIELLKCFRLQQENLPIIVITGVEDRTISTRALQSGAYWYLEKPLDLVEAEVLIGSIARWRVATDQVAELRVKAEESYHPSLVALSSAIFSAEDFSSLMKMVSQEAPTFLSADECQIVPLDIETGEIKDKQAITWGEKALKFSHHFEGRQLSEELMESGGYTIVQNVRTEIGVHPDLVATGIEAFCGAACPQAPGAGAILYAYFHAALGNEQTLALKAKLISLARLVGTAMERVRQTKLLQAMTSSGQELLAAHSQDEIIEIVHRTIQDGFEIPTFYLALHDEKVHAISFPIFVDKGEPYPTEDRPDSVEEGGLTGHILRTGQEYGSDDLEKDQLPARPKPIGTLELPKVFFGVPLRLPSGKIIGVLSIQRYIPHPFSQTTRQVIRNLATQVALAIERIRTASIRERLLVDLATKPMVQILTEIGKEVQEATQADIVTIHPYDPRRMEFTPERVRFGLPESLSTSRFRGDENRALERLLARDEHFAVISKNDDVFKGKFVKKHNIISSDGVTLTIGNPPVKVGVLVVNYRSEHHFNESAKEELRVFGRRAALAINNYWLLERARSFEQRMLAEHQASFAIRKVQSPEDARRMLSEIANAIETAWPEKKVLPGLLFADPANRQLIFAEEIIDKFPVDIDTERGRRAVKYGEGITGWVAETGQSVIVPNVRKDPRYLKMYKGTESELCVPIKLGNSLLGVLDVEAPLINFFDDADRIFLERVADELAVALGASGRREHAETIMQATLQAARQPEKALDILTHQAHEIAGLTGGYPTFTTVFLLIENGLELVSAYPQDVLAKVHQAVGRVLPMYPASGQPRGIVVRAALERKSQLVGDVGQDLDYIAFHPETRAELAVPLMAADGSVIGILNVEYAKPEALTAEDQRLLETLANQTIVVAVLEKQSRKLVDEQLARQEASALALMGIAAVDYGHSWKTAGATIRGVLDISDLYLKKRREGWKGKLAALLSRRGIGLDDMKIQDWFERMRASTASVHNAIQFSQPGDDLECIPVNIWLQSVLDRWKIRNQDIDISIDIQAPDQACIEANRNWLTRGIDNLISNAARAAYKKPHPKVVLRSRCADHVILIEIQDNGRGIPKAAQPYLFLDVIPVHAGRIGRGAGCLMTKFIARFYNGNARLINTNRKGTTIALEFPAIPFLVEET